jgi:hypothetical protein
MWDHVDLFFSSKDSNEETHPLIVPFKSPSKSRGRNRPIERTKKEVDKTSKAKWNKPNYQGKCAWKHREHHELLEGPHGITRLDNFGFEPSGGEIRLGNGRLKWGFYQSNLKQGASQTYQAS